MGGGPARIFAIVGPVTEVNHEALIPVISGLRAFFYSPAWLCPQVDEISNNEET